MTEISRDDKIKAIAKWYEENDYKLKYDFTNTSDDTINKLYEIVANGNISEITDESDPIIMHIAGNYMSVNKNYTEMFKYYEMGAKKKNIGSIVNLAIHYENNGNIGKMLEYLDMAIELKDADAAHMCYSYYMASNDYNNAIKYCEIAIDLGCMDAIYDMSAIHNIIGNTEDAEKYFAIAEREGDIDAFIFNGKKYSKQKKYKKGFEYFLKAYAHNKSKELLEIMQDIKYGMLTALENDRSLLRNMAAKYIGSCKIKKQIDEMNKLLLTIVI